MSFLTPNAVCIVPAMAVSAPRRRRSGLMVARAAANAPKHLSKAADDGAYGPASGRRQAMMLVAATVSASLAAVSRSARAADVITKTGQYVEIKDVLTDSYVQDLGRWVIDVFNSQTTGEKLEFDKVVKGAKQVVAGTNYRLAIKTKPPTGSFEAVVFESLPNPKKEREIMSFKPLLL